MQNSIGSRTANQGPVISRHVDSQNQMQLLQLQRVKKKKTEKRFNFSFSFLSSEQIPKVAVRFPSEELTPRRRRVTRGGDDSGGENAAVASRSEQSEQ